MTTAAADRLLAEQAIIGSLLMWPEGLGRVGPLRPEDFAHPGCGAVFRAILALTGKTAVLDPYALGETLTPSEQASVGGLQGLLDTMRAVPHRESIGHHARLVRRSAAKLRLVSVAGQLVERARDDSEEPDEILADMAPRLADCHATDVASVSAEVIVRAIWDDCGRPPEERAQSTGVPTGIRVLDDKLTFGGLPRGAVTILAGTTSAGKSALANTCLLSAALRGQGVLCVALEDSAECVTRRCLAQLARIDNTRLQRGRIEGEAEWQRLGHAVGQLDTPRIQFLQDASGGAAVLAAQIRDHVQRHKPDLVIVDFLQLVPPGREHRTRQDEVDATFGELVRTARQLPCATLVVSQLRRVEDRAPTKSDLYHSGALEQWSHTVALLWRAPVPQWPGLVSLIVDKQKNGPTGRITLGWNPALVAFSDPEPMDADAYAQCLDNLGKRPSRK